MPSLFYIGHSQLCRFIISSRVEPCPDCAGSLGVLCPYLMLGGYDMKIIVLVDKSGNAQTIVKGVQGSSCVSATKPLLDKLGIITSDVKTEEYDGFVMTGVEQETVAQQVCRNFQG